VLEKLIVNLTPTGMVPTKDVTEHVPVTVPEIVEEVKRCVALGVNVLHLHARDDQGRPTYSKDVYARLIAGIREACPQVVIGVSLSGRNFGEFEQRADPLALTGDLKPDLASLTLGSMNFVRGASVNSPEMIERLAGAMTARGIKPELEVFDLGMVNYAHYLIRKGLLRPPHYFNVILGNVATAQAHPSHLGVILRELPDDSLWTCGGIGGAQLAANTLGILFGNGVRVGLEDNIWLDARRTCLATNAELVCRVVSLAGTLGREVGSADEVRTALGLSRSAPGGVRPA
jgi:3-keto-5-aminohexanoate cleavage enzyme